MVPINLVDAIKDVGFDYGMSVRDVAARVVEGHLVLWRREVALRKGVIDEPGDTERRADGGGG